MRTSIFGAVAFVLGTALAGSAGAQTVVSSDIIVDTPWSGEIVLSQPIFVKSGAILTIAPGTIVRGQPRTAAVAPGSTIGTPGTLIVTNNGTIIANGTPASPIIMTTAAVDNDGDGVPDDLDRNLFLDAYPGSDPTTCVDTPTVPNPNLRTCDPDATPTFLDNTPTTAPLAPLAANGRANVALWGGLVVLGNATTNMGIVFGLGQGLGTVEGLTVPGFPVADATYGGSVGVGDDADSSGSLSYLSVRHAGDEIGNTNELNGVTLAGVGNGTEFHHVEVYANFDDGIEWFGGTVNGNHLQVVFPGDDIFDADQGYRGTNQFMVGILPFFNQRISGVNSLFGSDSGDKGCEFDGDDQNVDPPAVSNVNSVGGQPTPFSNGNFYNLTISGSRPSAFFNGHTNNNDGCEMRNGFAGSIVNGLIFNTGGDGAGGTAGRQGLDLAGGGFGTFAVQNNANNGLIVASSISCDNVLKSPLLSTFPTDPIGGVTSVELVTFGNGVNNVGCENGVNDPGFRLNDRDTAFTPTGVAGKLDASLGSIDFRISFLNNVTANGISPAAPLDTAATYRGAYDAIPEMWTTGWTALSMAGMQPVPEPGLGAMVAAGAMGLLAISRRRR